MSWGAVQGPDGPSPVTVETGDWQRLALGAGFLDPISGVAVAACSIAGAARQDGASLWKSCFAEAVDIDLR
jgi:hypothetical protein